MGNSAEGVDANNFELESMNQEMDKAYKDYLIKKVEDGLNAIKEGRVLSHEDALKRILGR